MKLRFTLPLLVAAFAPLVAGCGADPESTEREPTEEATEAQISTGGGGAPNTTEFWLIIQGYTCAPLDGHDFCTKPGSPPYICGSDGNCTAASTAATTYRFQAAVHPGSCMDVAGAGTADGTNIQEWTCNGTAAQAFRVEALGGGWSRIVNTNSNKCVDAAGNGTADGTNIQLYTCNGTSAQAWQLVNAGNGLVMIIGQNSNNCIDVAGGGTANGTNIQLYRCNSTSAQLWTQTLISGT